MLDVLKTTQINIKDLSLEQPVMPTKGVFDPEKDIPFSNWVMIKKWLGEQFPITATPGTLEDFFTVATRAYLLFPQRREDLNLSDKLFDRRMHDLNSGFNMARDEEIRAQWRYILPTAVDIKLAFPEYYKDFRLRESDWKTAYEQMQQTRATNPLPERIRLGFNALVMFPEYYRRDASGYIPKEELAAYFEALSKKDLTANEVEDVGKGRVVAPEVDPATYFITQHWKSTLEFLKQPLTQPDKPTISYVRIANSLPLATAKEVAVTQQGLMITPFTPPVQLQSIPSIPNQRRF